MDYLKPLFVEPSPKENATFIHLPVGMLFFEREMDEVTFSVLRSFINPATAKDFEHYHSCVSR